MGRQRWTLSFPRARWHPPAPRSQYRARPTYPALDQLTRREQEMLLEVAIGLSNAEIAE